MDHSLLPDNSSLAQVYWIFVGGFIVLAAVVHGKDCLEYRLRDGMRYAYLSRSDPARPQNIWLCIIAALTAIVREATYHTMTFVPSQGIGKQILNAFPKLSHLPPTGHILLISLNLIVLLTITFYNLDPGDHRNWESIAVRAGWMTLTQLPLVILLAGRSNLVAMITGTSYERLNSIHRSLSRCMFVTLLIHFSFFLRSWARYDYIGVKFKTDANARDGLAVLCVFMWLLISSLAPIRGWKYEIFFLQHVVTVVGLLYAVWRHIPDTQKVRNFVWAPVAIWAIDRVLRWMFLIYNNLSVFHKSPHTIQNTRSSAFTCSAVFQQLPDRATRITIRNPPFRWKPGQHAFVSCHSLSPFQSHPFTISSLPSDGQLEFVVQAQSGGTSEFYKYAAEIPLTNLHQSSTVLIDGPYGRMRPLEQFDTVVLYAGSTGASFIVPLFRNILHLKQEGVAVVTRKIRLIWVVKGSGQLEWFKEILQKSYDQSDIGNIELEFTVYITCNPSVTIGTDIQPQSRIGTFSSSRSDSSKAEKLEGLETVANVDTRGKPNQSCGGNGGCLCTAVLEEDDSVITEIKSRRFCSVKTTHSAVHKFPASGNPNSYVQKFVGSLRPINVISGRPSVHTILEKELQQARGESAVVVCGPHGLIEVTRRAVVLLSDERAVNKGTGAQGIYLHSESFSF